MIEIEAPDGSIVEFPDGTPDATIEGAMRSTFGGASGADTAADTAARGLPPLMVRQKGPFGMVEVPAARSSVAHRNMSLGQTVQAVADTAGGMATGVAQALPGIPGNIEAFGRSLLSPFGVDRETALPKSTDIGNKIAGPAANEQVAGGRQIGEFFGPGILTALYRGARSTPQQIASTLAPNPDPGVSALAQRARALNVPIRPGQAASSRAVKVVDDQLAALPSSLTGNSTTNPNKITPAAQHEAFTRAVSKTFGEDAPALTQDVMAQADSRMGKVFDEVLSRNIITPSQTLTDKLKTIRDAAVDQLDDDAAPILKLIDSKINGRMIANGEISGRQYQTMRARGGAIDRLTGSQDTAVAHYARQVREALDDAFQAQAIGDDGARLSDVRAQFRNMRVVEPLAAKAPTGQISPALLLGEVRREFPNFATDGAGDLGDLARIGQQFLKSPPNSETATRSLLMRALENPGAAIAKTAAAPMIATVGRGINSAINSQTAASRLFANPAQNTVVPGGGANVPALDPRLLAAMSPSILLQLLSPGSGQIP